MKTIEQIISSKVQEAIRTYRVRQTRRMLILLFTLVSISSLFLVVWAQTTTVPGHPANQVRPGAFQAFPYSFPNSLAVGSLSGAGLVSCSDPSQKLLYTSATKTFSCGNDANSISPTVGTSCELLGSTSSIGQHVIVPAPACMGTMGGCRLYVVAVDTSTGQGIVSQAEAHFSSSGIATGSRWRAIGIGGSSFGTTIMGGTFGGPGSETIITNPSSCMILDDGAGSMNKVDLFQGSTQTPPCQFFVCP